MPKLFFAKSLPAVTTTALVDYCLLRWFNSTDIEG